MNSLILFLFLSFSFTVNPLSATQTNNIESTVIAGAEPCSFVNNTVNAIFGSFYHHSVDLIVPGPEPLHIQRYYNSQNTVPYSSLAMGMTTNYPHWLHILPHKDNAEYIEMIAEEDAGSIVKYIAKPRKRKMGFYLHPEVIHKGLTNAGSSEISGRTNLKNNRYTLENDFHHDTITGTWTASLANGNRRKYHRMDDSRCYLNLKYEEKLSGNKILFEYNSDGKIKKIEATDAREKETLGSLKFDQHDHKLTINASNGKFVEYKFFVRDSKENDDCSIRYLEKVTSSDALAVSYDYEKINGERYVRSISWPEGAFLKLNMIKKRG